MKVVFTTTADSCLSDIYLYHRDYSYDYAVDFQTEIERHLTFALGDNPQLGRVYNRERSVRRLVYKEKYNVYYVVEDGTIFVVFIYDGQMNVNQQIELGDADMPDFSEE